MINTVFKYLDRRSKCARWQN